MMWKVAERSALYCFLDLFELAVYYIELRMFPFLGRFLI